MAVGPSSANFLGFSLGISFNLGRKDMEFKKLGLKDVEKIC
jgi:hypothetical protein